MKFLFYCTIIMILISGCTLSKEELLQTPEAKIITLNLDYTIDRNNPNKDYILILLNDTTDLHNQVPVSFGKKDQFLFTSDKLQKGFWILLKKWVGQDSVYESEPLFLTFQVPENSNVVNVKLKDIIPIKSRKIIYQIDSVSFNVRLKANYNGSEILPWDANGLDDAVSGSLPDIYFKIDNFFSTGYTDFIDQPIGRFIYKFRKTFIPYPVSTITLNCYDYDFNVSSDDLMYSIRFDFLGKYNITITDNGISKRYDIGGDDEYRGYSYTYSYGVLSCKIY